MEENGLHCAHGANTHDFTKEHINKAVFVSWTAMLIMLRYAHLTVYIGQS